jgi:hypothetical protein
MRARVLLTSLCIVWFFLLSWQPLLFPQETPGKAKPNPIEGEWIELIWERDGVPQSTLPDLRPARLGEMGWPTHMYGKYLIKQSKWDRTEKIGFRYIDTPTS